MAHQRPHHGNPGRRGGHDRCDATKVRSRASKLCCLSPVRRGDRGLCLRGPRRAALRPATAGQCPAHNLDEAISYFDEFLKPGWQACGVTPLEIKELCRRQGRSLYFLYGHRMLDSYEPPVKNRLKSVAMTSWGGHAYLYSSARVVCTKHLANPGSSMPVRLANDSHYELPSFSEWKPRRGTPAPGYHYTQDLNAARAELLLSGRSPKVVLRNAAAADMVALRYVCVKARDGASGACVIRGSLPTRTGRPSNIFLRVCLGV